MSINGFNLIQILYCFKVLLFKNWAIEKVYHVKSYAHKVFDDFFLICLFQLWYMTTSHLQNEILSKVGSDLETGVVSSNTTKLVKKHPKTSVCAGNWIPSFDLISVKHPGDLFDQFTIHNPPQFNLVIILSNFL